MNIVLHYAQYSQYSTVYCHDELWIVQARTVRFVIQVKLSCLVNFMADDDRIKTWNKTQNVWKVSLYKTLCICIKS